MNFHGLLLLIPFQWSIGVRSLWIFLVTAMYAILVSALLLMPREDTQLEEETTAKVTLLVPHFDWNGLSLQKYVLNQDYSRFHEDINS
jgi:hypothetical protein